MARWVKKIRGFRDLLGDDSSVEAIREAAEKVSALLKVYSVRWLEDDKTAEEKDIIGEMALADFDDIIAHIEDISDCDEFNETLEEFYDWCDMNSVWVEWDGTS